jgi:hypothetical protein
MSQKEVVLTEAVALFALVVCAELRARLLRQQTAVSVKAKFRKRQLAEFLAKRHAP